MSESRGNLFQLGNFTLHSGVRSIWKIDCDALTSVDLYCLAHLIRRLVPPFYRVEGVPQGGLRLAEALRPFASPQGEGICLLVDDVLTTGGSLERVRRSLETEEGITIRKVVGVVLFARGSCPSWVWPLFQLPGDLWEGIP